MIDVPVGKALAPVEKRARETRYFDRCRICDAASDDCFGHLACDAKDRKDGKDVFYKFVDLPEGGNNGTA